MILCDANVLLYAYDSHAQQHLRCRDWFVQRLNGAEPIGLPWQTLLAFVRIATNARVYAHPLTTDSACRLVAAWLGRPQACIPAPGERYWSILQTQLTESRVAGPMVTDAALAALAMELGATLCTTDRDFRRFDGLKLFDPMSTRADPS